MDVKQRPMDEAMVFQRLWDLKARGKLHTREKKTIMFNVTLFGKYIAFVSETTFM